MMEHEQLVSMIGVEHGLDEVNRGLCHYVRGLGPAAVGAMHVTCADESEWECVDSFQRMFVHKLLPELKLGKPAPFRLSNLGGRYEWGAIPVAEHHYATPESSSAFKVLMIKVNAHVAAVGARESQTFGGMERYDCESAACGALHALLAGKTQRPFLDDLREAFNSGGVDRLAQLHDESSVDRRFRSLLVAVVHARLQVRRVELDIHRHRTHSPTIYLIAAGVTLNRPGPDTEILCGLYSGDYRGDTPVITYNGLGDDPSRLRVAYGDDPAGSIHLSEV